MYKAILRTDETVDASLLHEEFSNWPNAKLNPIYAENSDWTGVCVYNRSDVNYLDELPALRSLVTRVGLQHVTGVRYFNLAPKSKLHRHRDMYGNLLFGIIRIHIPIRTNPLAIMEVEKKCYHLGLNELWCIDTSGLHSIWNDGHENRIHIVIDVKRHPETEKYFPRWSPSVITHLAYFLMIVAWKVARDSVYQPKSLLKRIVDLKKEI